jgi:pyridinium-3,5-bisthiocarboxylic acid mononucleotide nickel chelatase
MPENEKIAVIDCQVAGVSGDMFLGALIDLGANVDKIVSAIKSLENPATEYKNIKVDIKQVMKREFKATYIDVTAEFTPKTEGKKLIDMVEKTIQTLDLSEKAKHFASNVIQTLVNTEATLHRTNLADAHLHEIGLIDTAAEIIGSAVALEDLGLFNSKIYATPVSVGGGLFKFSHGISASPAPATLAIFQSKNFPIKGGPIEEELATPTGASIIVNLVDEVSRFYPAMAPLKTGYGAGTKNFAEMPNVLRITLGKPTDNGFLKDEITVIETNLDDVSGEIIGHSVERLLQEGAKDVSIIPMFTKKNRPGQILKIIADKKDSEHLCKVLIAETGTLGIREYNCERHIVCREQFQVDIFIDEVKETVNIKVAKDTKGKIIRIKPEYDDLKKIADQTKKPLREISELAYAKAKEVILKKGI